MTRGKFRVRTVVDSPDFPPVSPVISLSSLRDLQRTSYEDFGQTNFSEFSVLNFCNSNSSFLKNSNGLREWSQDNDRDDNILIPLVTHTDLKYVVDVSFCTFFIFINI